VSIKETEGTIAEEILALVSFIRRPGDKNSPEASQEHLLETLFHHILQKVRGLVVGFTKLRRNGSRLKNTLMRMDSQGEFAS
jgi:hypothetical protein